MVGIGWRVTNPVDSLTDGDQIGLIDLFGDAGTQEASTRLDGVLVVDRASGVLLRLDLFSGHPVFQLQRRLARVEHLP